MYFNGKLERTSHIVAGFSHNEILYKKSKGLVYTACGMLAIGFNETIAEEATKPICEKCLKESISFEETKHRHDTQIMIGNEITYHRLNGEKVTYTPEHWKIMK